MVNMLPQKTQPVKINKMSIPNRVRLVLILIVVTCSISLRSSLASTQLEASKTANISRDSETIRKNLAKIKTLLDWNTYQKRFNKSYSSASEQLFRFKQFLARSLRAVASLTSYVRGKSGYYLTINKFSDRTAKELHQTFDVQLEEDNLNQISQVEKSDSKRVKRDTKGNELETNAHGNWFSRLFSPFGRNGKSKKVKTVDWRDSGCLNGPRWQGECGSCYIMTTLELLEWSHCRQFNGSRVKFSEQFVVDCGRRAGLNGCTAGTIKKTIEFIGDHGLMLNKDKPYVAREDQCPLDEPDKSVQVLRPKSISYNLHRNASEWSERLLEQPLVVCLLLKDEFFDYGGGMMTANDCNLERDVRHYVTLVGMGVESGKEYWLMANNFGEDWGKGGHVKIEKRGSENCIIYMMSTNVEFEQDVSHLLTVQNPPEAARDDS